LDGWARDLVTAVEGIDYADVAGRLRWLDVGIFCCQSYEIARPKWPPALARIAWPCSMKPVCHAD